MYACPVRCHTDVMSMVSLALYISTMVLHIIFLSSDEK